MSAERIIFRRAQSQATLAVSLFRNALCRMMIPDSGVVDRDINDVTNVGPVGAEELHTKSKERRGGAEERPQRCGRSEKIEEIFRESIQKSHKSPV